jgi:hypothetical protein
MTNGSLSGNLTSGGIINSIQENIMSLSKQIWYQDMRRIEFHESLKKLIYSLASSYGYNGLCEYRLPGYRRKDCNIGGIVDVVWFKSAYPIIVFEIDSSLKKKSIDKLLFTYNSICFWINYGKRHPHILLKELDHEQRINLIRIENLDFKRRT